MLIVRSVWVVDIANRWRWLSSGPSPPTKNARQSICASATKSKSRPSESWLPSLYDLRRKQVGEFDYSYKIHDGGGNGISLGAWDDEKQQQFEDDRAAKARRDEQRTCWPKGVGSPSN